MILLSESHEYLDTIQINTVLTNEGDAATSFYTFAWTTLTLGQDSLFLKVHTIDPFITIAPGEAVVYTDTMITFKGPFSIWAWADPLGSSGESTVERTNNVNSLSFNFHPEIITDTVTVIQMDTLVITDTVEIHDTVLITDSIFIIDTVLQIDTVVQTDTIINTDTVVVHDTVTNIQGPDPAKRRKVSLQIYDLHGKIVWTGKLYPGEFPRKRLPQGLYLRVTADGTRKFKVRYLQD